MRVAVVAIVLLLLAACGPRMVESDVTRFSALPSGPSPGSVTIIPLPDQRGSLEFQAYAEMVAEELRLAGYQPTPATARPAADYEARLTWGVGDAVTEFRSSPGTVFGGTSIFGNRTGYGMGIGVPLGNTGYVDSTTRYTKWVRLVLRPFGNPDAANVFEGSAVTREGGTTIDPVMPYLVEALFTNFPGGSGTTERVRIPQR
ncbi:MAG: hypothetical protein WCZ23_14475 [Rhodospirillaceae bacterium]